MKSVTGELNIQMDTLEQTLQRLSCLHENLNLKCLDII